MGCGQWAGRRWVGLRSAAAFAACVAPEMTAAHATPPMSSMTEMTPYLPRQAEDQCSIQVKRPFNSKQPKRASCALCSCPRRTRRNFAAQSCQFRQRWRRSRRTWPPCRAESSCSPERVCSPTTDGARREGAQDAQEARERMGGQAAAMCDDAVAAVRGQATRRRVSDPLDRAVACIPLAMIHVVSVDNESSPDSHDRPAYAQTIDI
eukprot:6461548-Prymnesium_polylepis.2